MRIKKAAAFSVAAICLSTGLGAAAYAAQAQQPTACTIYSGDSWSAQLMRWLAGC